MSSLQCLHHRSFHLKCLRSGEVKTLEASKSESEDPFPLLNYYVGPFPQVKNDNKNKSMSVWVMLSPQLSLLLSKNSE